MKKIFAAMITVLLLIVVGCSSQGKLTRDDLCIQRVDDKAKICYGMERVEVEKVAGKGEVDSRSKNRFLYENELEVIYRDNKAVLITTRSDHYEHISTTGVGKLPDELEKKYGPSVGGGYYYDEKNRKMLTVDELKKVSDLPETIIVLSTYIDKNGYIFSISVGDLKSFNTAS
ncbi:hypothetical protein FLT15_31640 [Paenibacillus thiaminolyticus]|uniref:hypothetical protein n=1 Tax=Paenibacillus thiaminolyticus TaxID=49283 RepID=UPI0011621D11|nr:hypothetical protein [Paenibacillus thiaminolyticus]MDG0876499.1 hypothetical protein [Paenibacillus thiaminolyticus]NGP58831.1 hypothetical protein [Paenibacillus thiaminolyticus]NGP62722.1 hypothetical protein [Paenibacillus thiaminolyticus]WII39713.1 hypothetical protein O0V01_11720 [Paenibacillus thiaminolyticus]